MKKIISILIGMLMLLSLVGCGFSEDFKQGYDSETKYVGININKIEELPVKNGNGEEIGKRGTVIYNADKITDESLTNFYNDKIKDSGYNYYTLINEKDKKQGIVSPGCIKILSHGEIDDTGSLIKADKDITID
ncbi:hypothetical protein FDE76_01445 [Clostridium botulinum]|uniref:Lipoprotein n=1 Tax=Clostridium botulinum (strain Eklund 17B / Type B) TaxID=935198 RepID=B2TMI0_CLOBB|nr:hypothetical protein [Clostridium sp. M14]ACD22970.1 putative lipoprotein [Clostridium botulinum B str. Eklund 17B (NRP)]MBY6975199.1 hypothetical protein [Clostridium botulinum]MBY7000180.1 hypothetical protein [Clostridium botulinum]MBZ9690728.1 hypothetical protein [Clostridium sp. M14]MCR1274955.1 hypothetical protein [Clostridium botulinum]